MEPYHKPVEHPVLGRNLATLRSLDPQLDSVASILELLTGLITSFELQKTGDDAHYSVYCITRARTSYLLLHVPRMDLHTIQGSTAAPVGTVLCEMIRLAALVLLLQLSGFDFALASNAAARLNKLLIRYDRRWTGLSELQLWVLTIAAVSTDDPRHRASLASRITIIKDELELSWTGLGEALRSIAWTDGLFQDRLRELSTLANPTTPLPAKQSPSDWYS
jgi:hypothetical protein